MKYNRGDLLEKAKAMVLDKLSSSWKGNIYANEVYLEDKLTEMVKNN